METILSKLVAESETLNSICKTKEESIQEDFYKIMGELYSILLSNLEKPTSAMVNNKIRNISCPLELPENLSKLLTNDIVNMFNNSSEFKYLNIGTLGVSFDLYPYEKNIRVYVLVYDKIREPQVTTQFLENLKNGINSHSPPPNLA